MIFEQHLNLKGQHAFLSPSQPQWLRYTDEQLLQKRISTYAQPLGTALHSLAETLIKNNLKIKAGDKLTVLSHLLNDGIPRDVIDMDRIYNNFRTYVNDAIGFKLTPEQILYYSNKCFGTADAISFRDNKLRIHDYKSGSHPAKMDQLMVYAAIFCLEYKIKPGTIDDIELRIYQNDEIVYHKPEADEILPIMDTIVHKCKVLDEIQNEEA